MKLMPEALKKRFAEVGEQLETENPLVVAKFFDPTGSATWYATTYYPITNTCYGYVTGLAVDEWGTFSIDELESLKLPFTLSTESKDLHFKLSIERDLHFNEIPFDALMKKRSRELDRGQSPEDIHQEL